MLTSKVDLKRYVAFTRYRNTSDVDDKIFFISGSKNQLKFVKALLSEGLSYFEASSKVWQWQSPVRGERGESDFCTEHPLEEASCFQPQTEEGSCTETHFSLKQTVFLCEVHLTTWQCRQYDHVVSHAEEVVTSPTGNEDHKELDVDAPLPRYSRSSFHHCLHYCVMSKIELGGCKKFLSSIVIFLSPHTRVSNLSWLWSEWENSKRFDRRMKSVNS